MDPPPLPPYLTTTTQPDSSDCSPRSRAIDTCDEDSPPVPGARLRLMCSYGGHIIPRPHDKSLCYVGGQTRIVALDRQSSLLHLSVRLSRSLLNGRHFTLKYQLPNEDLDNLVSVATDEDLENMMDEYDRIAASSPVTPSRIRLFLFSPKPETAASMGSLLADAKSETWFVDALNSTGMLPRGLSESAAIDQLVVFEEPDEKDDHDDNTNRNELEIAQVEISVMDHESNYKQVMNKNDHEVQQQYILDSTLVENSSSFGSSSSTPSMSNLPPIRARVEDNNRIGLLEEQIAQHNIETSQQAKASDDNSAFVSNENQHRMSSDEERTEQALPANFRKPPLPLLLQPVQYNQKVGLSHNLASPDSVASDSSIASAISLSKQVHHQEPVHVVSRDSRSPAISDDQSSDHSDLSYRNHLIQQVHEQQQQQQQQQQFFHASPQYIHHPASATGQVPMSPYYSYSPPSYHQQQMEYHQYPMYLMPVSQTQTAYNLVQQSSVPDASSVPTPSIIASSAAHKEALPPIYPSKVIAASQVKPESSGSIYKSVMPGNPASIQIPSNQYHQPQQYVGFSQYHHPSQSVASNGYTIEYVHPTNDQMYYTQHPPAPLSHQYQTMNAAAAVALSEASLQLPNDK